MSDTYDDPLQLFETERFRDNSEFVRSSVFIRTKLPYFPPVDDFEVPETDVWSDSGIHMFIQSNQDAVRYITGLDGAEQTAEAIFEKLAEYKGQGMWCKALNLAYSASKLDSFSDVAEQLQAEGHLATRAYLHIGLNEARVLPFDDTSKYDDDAEPISAVSLSLLGHFIKLADLSYARDPETFGDYYRLAAEIHAEMIVRYKWLGDYTHQLWKSLDMDEKKEEILQRLGKSLVPETEEGREQMAIDLHSCINNSLQGYWLDRFEEIAVLGRETELLDHDAIMTLFAGRFSQLDLKGQLLEQVRQDRSISPPNYPAQISMLDSVAGKMSMVDGELSAKMRGVLNSRLLEVAQGMATADDLLPGEPRMIREETWNLVFQMDNDDPQKPDLVKKVIAEKVEDIVKAERMSALVVDRTLQDFFEAYARKYFDTDQAMIFLTEVVDKVIANIDAPEAKDPLEPLIAVIAVFSRNKIPHQTPKRIVEATKNLLPKLIEQSRTTGSRDWEWYEELLEKISQGPEVLHEHYWEHNEEYYS